MRPLLGLPFRPDLKDYFPTLGFAPWQWYEFDHRWPLTESSFCRVCQDTMGNYRQRKPKKINWLRRLLARLH